MADRQDGMVPEHARSGIAHNRLNAGAHFGIVAMHRALVANRLSIPEWTPGNPLLRIRQQLGALFTHIYFGAVMSAAIHVDHGGNGPDFKIHDSNTIERSAPFQDRTLSTSKIVAPNTTILIVIYGFRKLVPPKKNQYCSPSISRDSHNLNERGYT